jgi:hypothetical protein
MPLVDNYRQAGKSLFDARIRRQQLVKARWRDVGPLLRFGQWYLEKDIRKAWPQWEKYSSPPSWR